MESLCRANPIRPLPPIACTKPSGQAVVTDRRADHYLGPYGSPESHEEYERLIAEFRALQEDFRPGEMKARSRPPALR